MTGYDSLAREEIEATITRAGFEQLYPEAVSVEITDSFGRKLGECRAVASSDGEPTGDYEIRIARRLFEGDDDDTWRDTVRHEVAHAYVLDTVGSHAQPHGDEWKAAARRAGADPVARCEGDETVDATYVLACPNGCFERGYLQRTDRVKQPWQYTCDGCGTQPISYDVGERPVDPDPGTCYMASLPWRTRSDRDDGDDRHSSARYLLACSNGCTTWPYQRRTKRIKNPWLYSCPECEETLLSCDIDDHPIDLAPGRCHVASIPWQEPRLVHACPNGCFSVGHGQHTDESRHPERYRCEECGTQTVVYPADDRPESLDPGTNYVD
ncbi:SprT-like domain-containing protein [Saliphagus infecundisoli]|uniref:SprT-like domain-containing protein n=1 Tax=Saliphagus infecundisoli TaxID=1849069 RepID=A0ABD5QH49_9EURY|nr:SprT-like domain-containing protein [Saliphagus infecundisoli]